MTELKILQTVFHNFDCMYNSHFYQKEIAPEVYIEKVRELAREYGLFQIYDAQNTFVDEFIRYELLTFDTRKINLDEILSALIEVLSEWKILCKSFKKAIPNELINLENISNDVLYSLGGLSNRVFSSKIADYVDYLLNFIHEVWLNKLMLDFGKLEHLSAEEINYALMIMNEENERFTHIEQGQLKQLLYLWDLTIKRLIFIRDSKQKSDSPILKDKISSKKKEVDVSISPPFFEDFLQGILFETLQKCFIQNKICTQEGNFIAKIGGQNPFPSPIMIVFLPEILDKLGYFDMVSWETQALKDKIKMLSVAFGVKNNPSYFSNAASKNNRPSDSKLLRFEQLIQNALIDHSTV